MHQVYIYIRKIIKKQAGFSFNNLREATYFEKAFFMQQKEALAESLLRNG